jgi:hypothetical protein
VIRQLLTCEFNGQGVGQFPTCHQYLHANEIYKKFWEELIALLSFHYKLRVSLGTGRIENTVSNSSSIVTGVFVAARTCLQSRCLAVAVPSGFTIPAFRRHVTLLTP